MRYRGPIRPCSIALCSRASSRRRAPSIWSTATRLLIAVDVDWDEHGPRTVDQDEHDPRTVDWDEHGPRTVGWEFHANHSRVQRVQNRDILSHHTHDALSRCARSRAHASRHILSRRAHLIAHANRDTLSRSTSRSEYDVGP